MVSFLESFSSGAAAEGPLGEQRKVDLSGNVFSFSMPEDFSKDFLLEPMRESVDVTQAGGECTLIQRWWDLKDSGWFDSGWFGKDLGSVMLMIRLQAVPENRSQLLHSREFRIDDRWDFMLAIYENFETQYAEVNRAASGMDGGIIYSLASLATQSSDGLRSDFRDHLAHGQKWTSYFIGSIGSPSNAATLVYAMPVTRDSYLEATFIVSPNDGVAPLFFMDWATETTIQPIIDSFQIDYATENPMRSVTGGTWLEQTVIDVVRSNEERITEVFFRDLPEYQAE